uniref:RpiB/LacA/LacB family sugar-phosphate isomerase n=1 Tax=Staphylococcus saprophyticus TaxID=29385 RepID=UPI00177CDD7D
IPAHHNRYHLKQPVKPHLHHLPHLLQHFPSHQSPQTHYPHVPPQVPKTIQQPQNQPPIFISPTPIPLPITPNKIKPIPPPLPHHYYSPQPPQLTNNPQILTIRAQIIPLQLPKKNVQPYLNLTCQARSHPKLHKIHKLQQTQNN